MASLNQQKSAPVKGCRHGGEASVPLTLAMLLLGALSACSGLDEGGDDCANLGYSAEECDTAGTGGGSVQPDNWACLTEGEAPRPGPVAVMEGMPNIVTFVVPIVDFANPLVVTPMNLKILSCSAGDFNCDVPLSVADPRLAAVQPDPSRPYIWAVPLPPNFDGYLRITADGYIQNEYYFLGPVVGGPNGERTILGDGIGIPRQTTLNSFFTEFGIRPQDGTGVVALRVFDCRNNSVETQMQRTTALIPPRAAGVQLEITNPADGEDASGFALINNYPSAADPPPATDGRGVAGFANVQPRGVLIEGITAGGVRYGRTSIRVRPNQLTQANLRPNYTYAD